MIAAAERAAAPPAAAPRRCCAPRDWEGRQRGGGALRHAVSAPSGCGAGNDLASACVAAGAAAAGAPPAPCWRAPSCDRLSIDSAASSAATDATAGGDMGAVHGGDSPAEPRERCVRGGRQRHGNTSLVGVRASAGAGGGVQSPRGLG
ncbi:hypothetical protein MNEG_10789 [Monoraphidium neglectum]|uniref:Uncharacterized protein n=1 Tax=Monoraphidium neglectum TaxID=145388 RepID=A0A0D2KNH9_9CHLO|nr:hypothetical protein MNEG_10789 [Monoraphidium neglectum]KIY97173.1 hypothetical protein MNEG_10789 [Monoraphidium neglectum]|eukprot:XP_013896193.1 hypothetical protein MNEG_10789 [Monoraphidium neglectum]